jgi:hypothetical protein
VTRLLMPEKKIKITCIIGSLDRGGCENHLVNIMPDLDRNLFEVNILTLFKKGELYTQTIQCQRRIDQTVKIYVFRGNAAA